MEKRYFYIGASYIEANERRFTNFELVIETFPSKKELILVVKEECENSKDIQITSIAEMSEEEYTIFNS